MLTALCHFLVSCLFHCRKSPNHLPQSWNNYPSCFLNCTKGAFQQWLVQPCTTDLLVHGTNLHHHCNIFPLLPKSGFPHDLVSIDFWNQWIWPKFTLHNENIVIVNVVICYFRFSSLLLMAVLQKFFALCSKNNVCDKCYVRVIISSVVLLQYEKFFIICWGTLTCPSTHNWFTLSMAQIYITIATYSHHCTDHFTSLHKQTTSRNTLSTLIIRPQYNQLWKYQHPVEIRVPTWSGEYWFVTSVNLAQIYITNWKRMEIVNVVICYLELSSSLLMTVLQMLYALCFMKKC